MPNDPATLEELLRHANFVRGLAKQLVADASSADDLVQDTFLAAVRVGVVPGPGIRTWLATTLKRTASNLRRTVARRVRRESRSALPEPHLGALDIIERVELERLVVSRVMELPEPFRTTILLRFHEGLKPSAIAQRCGVPVRTVETRLRRALDRLRERLDADAGGRAAWMLPLVQSIRITAIEGMGVAAMSIGIKAAFGTAIIALLMALFFLDLSDDGRRASAERTDGQDRAVAPGAALQPDAVERNVVPGTAVDPRVRASLLQPHRNADPSSAVTELVLLDPLGLPLADAPIAVQFSDGLVIGRHFDDNGVLDLPATGENCSIVVVPDHWVEFEMTLELTAGRRVLNFPNVERVAGQVVVDGRAPTEAVWVTMRCEQQVSESRSRSPKLRALITELLASRPEIRASTDPSGRFEFLGVPSSVRGYVKVDLDWYETHGSNVKSDVERVDFDHPTTSIVMNIKRRPRVTGVLRDPSSGSFDGFGVLVVSESKNPEVDGVRYGLVDSVGRFAAPIPSEAICADLVVRDGAQMDIVSVPLRGDLSRDFDLGTIDIPPRRTIRVAVFGHDGLPASDCSVWMTDSPLRNSCNRMGNEVTLELPLTAGHVSVTASGHQTAIVDISSIGKDEVDVRLEKATQLVLAADGLAPERAYRFSIESDVALVETADFPVHVAMKSGHKLYSRKSSGQIVLGVTRDAPVVVVDRIRSGVQFEVKLIDEFDMVHDSKKLQLNETERVDLTLRGIASGRTIAVSVTDARGFYLDRARVRVTTEEGSIVRATNAYGEATFFGMVDPRLSIRVSHGDYVWTAPEIVEVAENEFKRISVVMETGVPARIEIRNPLGQFVDANEVDIEVDTRGETYVAAWATRLAPGVFEAKTVPAGPIRFRVRTNQGEYLVAHDTGAGTAKLTIRSSGSLLVRWGFMPRDGLIECQCVLESLTSPGVKIEDSSVHFNPSVRGGEGRVWSIPPGRYRVTAQSRSERGSSHEIFAVGGEVEIESDQESVVELVMK